MSTEFEYYEPYISYDTWECIKCHLDFIDPEDFPDIKPQYGEGVEPRLYWLSETEPVCHECATRAGIPPIDER